MTQPNLYAAADYADALTVARRGKNVVFTLLLLTILAELALFFVARYTTTLSPPTQSMASVAGGVGNVGGTSGVDTQAYLRYGLGLIGFAGLVLPLLLGVMLFFLVHTLLAGRLLGAGPMTSAFLWSILLAGLLFPWQSFLNNPATTTDPARAALGSKIPGAIYTYVEFSNPRLGAHFPVTRDAVAAPDLQQYYSFLVLRWARFVGFPVVALVILIAIQMKSGRSLRMAVNLDQPVVPTVSRQY